jgi:alpha-tubulin suppressor-like RCC1 family protein
MHRVRSSLWSAAASLLLLVAACDDEAPNISGINPINISRIEIAPRIDTIFVADTAFPGDTVQYRATVFLHSGAARTDVQLVWETSDSSVAIVDQTGTVFPQGYGTTTVFASAGEQGKATLVVAPPPVTGLTVTPALDTIGVGQTVQLKPAATNDAGVIPGVRYEYSSSDPGVASVSAAGLVQGLAPGTATITVSIFSGFAGARTINVDIVVVEGLATANGVFAQLDAGKDFTCGRIPGDRAFCWGIDSVGQLGAIRADTVCTDIFGATRVDTTGVVVRDFPCSLLPATVQGDRTFTQMTAGGAQACGLAGDGTAWCWGKNDAGQLGNGNTRNTSIPALVTSALRFTQLAAGDRHTCGLIAGGAAYCWGDDGFGQLGNGERFFPAPSTTPIPVDPVSLRLTTISAGLTHTCGLDAGGRAWCWGSNAAGELGIGAASGTILHQAVQVPGVTYSSISAGENVTCGISGINLFCWGAGGVGQLGTGGTDSIATPRQVPGAYSAVAVGGTHVCALNTGGQALCWGEYDLRVSDTTITLGPGDVSQPPQSALVPTLIESGGVTFTAITSGQRHSCAMTADGAGYCWGSNVHGTFGDGLQALLRTRAEQRISATPEPTQP